MIVFPEGTRINNKTLTKSKQYADTNGKEYKITLAPSYILDKKVRPKLLLINMPGSICHEIFAPRLIMLQSGPTVKQETLAIGNFSE